MIDPNITFDSYTTYPSAFLVIDPNGIYSKHYYAGTQRIVSRLGDEPADIFNTGENRTTNKTNDSKKLDDNALRNIQVTDLKEYLKDAKIGKVSFKEYKGSTYQEEEEAILAEDVKENSEEGDFEQERAPVSAPVYFYHPDHLGSSTFLTDANGNPYQFFINLPFGETMAEQLPDTYYRTPFKFNGKELDEETGLYYYGARYYDPKISIWLSVDPLAEKFPGFNPYNYCMQNPINLVDIDGLFPEPWLIRYFERAWGNAKTIKFSNQIYSQMNNSWSKSFDKNNNSKEQGATLAVNISKKAFEFVNVGGNGSTSATFQPNINIDKSKYLLIGTFHTHPYGNNDGGWNGAFIPFSGGDFASMDDFDEAVSIVQSGKDVHVLVMTSKTPKNLDSAEAFYEGNFDKEYDKQKRNGVSSKLSAQKAGEFAVKKTAKKYNMIYFKGENGKELKKQ